MHNKGVHGQLTVVHPLVMIWLCLAGSWVRKSVAMKDRREKRAREWVQRVPVLI